MRLHVYLPDELVAHVDRVRGDVPRSKVVQRALEAVLATDAASGVPIPSRPRGDGTNPPTAPASPRAPANFGAVRAPSVRQVDERTFHLDATGQDVSPRPRRYVKPFRPQPKS